MVTTLAVIIWLRSKFSARHDEWEMIEMKTVTWLNSKLPAGKSLVEQLATVKQSLWPNGL